MKLKLRKTYWWAVLIFFWLVVAIIYVPVVYILSAMLAAISYPFNEEFKYTFNNILYGVDVVTPEKVYSLEFIRLAKERMEEFR